LKVEKAGKSHKIKNSNISMSRSNVKNKSATVHSELPITTDNQIL
jgi:hypothetical protein